MSIAADSSDAPGVAVELLVVSLADVGVAPEDLRALEPADADIPEVADTLKAAGLIYPLPVRSGRKGERPFMALDGRRRFLAYQVLVQRGVCLPNQPVRVELLRDKASQAAAVIVANTQRTRVHVADVIAAIGKMRSARFTTARIAVALGYPELEVKRLQRLAGFPPLRRLRRRNPGARPASHPLEGADTHPRRGAEGAWLCRLRTGPRTLLRARRVRRRVCERRRRAGRPGAQRLGRGVGRHRHGCSGGRGGRSIQRRLRRRSRGLLGRPARAGAEPPRGPARGGRTVSCPLHGPRANRGGQWDLGAGGAASDGVRH